jgi:SAM-dependent methyltransferase
VSLPVIEPTIITGMEDSLELASFYERTYSQDPSRASLYSGWRALSAVGKADHVIALCAAASIAPERVLDVGCGDGALLSELYGRRFGSLLAGVEIAPAPVAIARQRPEIDAVSLYDGRSLPFAQGEFDLGILSHVLEHVSDPPGLLREVARAGGAVVLEVPLEANWSARRGSKRAHAAEVGHLQRLSRADARRIVGSAGLRIVAEVEDPLPRAVHRFFAASGGERLAANARWGVRAALHRIAPPLARRAFTLHFACLCLPRDA